MLTWLLSLFQPRSRAPLSRLRERGWGRGRAPAGHPLPYVGEGIKILLTCLLLLTCGNLAAQSEDAPLPEVQLETPRSVGWHLGDVLEVTAHVTLPRGYTLEAASLPHPGPLNYWLELRDIRSQSRRKGEHERWQFSARYQTFYVPMEARQRRIPGYTLRFSKGDDILDVKVPGWTFTMSPLRQIAQQGGGLMLQADAPIRTRPQRWQRIAIAFAAFALLSLGLAHHYARWPFQKRPARPFTQAHQALRRQLKHGGEPAQALITLHRAFDAAAGECMLAADIGAFVAARPRLAAHQDDIARFFAASRRQFFGDAGAEMALPDLIALARTLAADERHAEAKA